MPDLPRTVFILGAGASVHAGAPVMKNFLDVAEDLLLGGHLDSQDAKQFHAVFKGMHGLQGSLAKASMDLSNIESVFAAFEMAALLGTGQDQVDGVKLTEAIRRLIVVTLEKTIKFPFIPGEINAGPRPTEEYSHFTAALRDIMEADRPVSIITFNYDVALDYAMERSLGFSYCLDGLETPEVHLLKLHGSLNWAKWINTKRKWCVTPRPLRGVPLKEWPQVVPNHVTSSVGSTMSGYRPPNSSWVRTHDLPLIVPPTWSKREHQRKIRNVWRFAAQDLSQADNIFVLGYSLPETDHFFRYLFALGTMGETRIKRFLVSDPAMKSDEALRRRFKALLGPLAAERFQCWDYTFGKAIDEILRSVKRNS